MTTVVLALAVAAAQAVSGEVIGEIRVHGNHTTPDADVLAIAALATGTPLAADTLAQTEARLRASGRFSNVEVRKRFRSIADPSDVLVILLVDEREGVSEVELIPSPMKRFRAAGMWLPILDYSEGYGFTYGARVSFVDVIGRRGRISVPLSWGGERRVAIEADRRFERGPLTRVEGGISLNRRVNPHYRLSDTRQEVRVRGERALTPWLRAGGGIGVTNVDFDDTDERQTTPSLDVVIDTRRDPAFPRNAVHATFSVARLRFASRTDVTRTATDIRGYIGLVRSTVLAVRASTSIASDALPRYEQPLLGGTSELRGYRFGYRAGDNLAVASAELRVPLTSPVNYARLGVKGFVDVGTVYPHGATLSAQQFDRGIGGGVFITATVFRMGLDVAWPESGRPRWHFGLGVTF